MAAVFEIWAVSAVIVSGDCDVKDRSAKNDNDVAVDALALDALALDALVGDAVGDAVAGEITFDGADVGTFTLACSGGGSSSSSSLSAMRRPMQRRVQKTMMAICD